MVGIDLAGNGLMATKSEQYKASTQRSAAAKKTAKKKPSRAAARTRAKPTKTAKTTLAHGNKGTGKNAAYVLEHAEGGAHPSRMSTRASAHHRRLDSSLTLRQEDRTRAPDSQFRRAKAKASRVRGKG
jgi:hypothetical protein